MNEILKSLEQSIEQKNWYAALTTGLTVPDIADDIDFPSFGSQKRYIMWFDKYIKPKYPTTDTIYYGIEGLVFGVSETHTQKDFLLTGEECYAIRCALLHEGRYSIKSQKVLKTNSNSTIKKVDRFADSVKFVYNDNSTTSELPTVQWISEQKILQLDICKFCTDIRDGIQTWLKDIEQDVAKQERIIQSLRIFSFSNIV